MTDIPAVTTIPKRASKMASDQSLNLNDLLNFTLPPRQNHAMQSFPRRSRKAGPHFGVWNKERFVNAQYRFVMNPTGDYTVHFADPDIFFQWQDILQIIVPRSPALASAIAGGEHGEHEGHTMCPICLSPPCAPRMTKCGHVFCFPCILHYLSVADNRWARCPICFDSVNEKQLKCVKWFDGPTQTADGFEQPHAESSSSSAEPAFVITPREGSLMRMRLMERPKITTLALPRSYTWPSDLVAPHQAPFHFLPDVYNFAKFMLATPGYLISDLARDLTDLSAERHTLASMNDDLGISFVDGADHKLGHQIAEAAALDTPALRDTIEKVLRDQLEIQQRVARIQRRGQEESTTQLQLSEVPEALLMAKSGGYPFPTRAPSTPTFNLDTSPSPNRSVPRQRRNLNPPPPSTSTYHYYQAASGLPIFLHPLDSKILLSRFGGYASFPDTITIRVESLSEGTVNDDLRKRCKYLAHMPESADVVFVEADLEGVVGSDGLKNFEVALKTRRARRKEKGRKDDRARARAEEREREKEKEQSTTLWSNVSRLVVPSAMPDISDPVEEPPPSTRQPDQPGAWGARSFASALHSTPAVSQPRAVVTRMDPEDEWDMDVAWHELEQRSGGGRRKRSNKLVVLGGPGGRRR